MPDFFQGYFDQVASCTRSIDFSQTADLARRMHACSRKRGKVIIVGNGGSAAIAAHVAVDLTKVGGVRAVTFNEADLLTCFSNDYGYEHWVEKAIEFYADDSDLAVLISSSGRSLNMINGARAAHRMGISIATLSGFDADNPLRKMGDVNLWADSRFYNVVETTHQTWLLAAVDFIAAGFPS